MEEKLRMIVSWRLSGGLSPDSLEDSRLDRGFIEKEPFLKLPGFPELFVEKVPLLLKLLLVPEGKRLSRPEGPIMDGMQAVL